jgi:hypothetical protein
LLHLKKQRPQALKHGGTEKLVRIWTVQDVNWAQYLA